MALSPGNFTVFCRACLDNSHVFDDDNDFGVVDATLFASRAINHSCIIASSLCFYKPGCVFREGVYDITANVQFLLFIFSNNWTQKKKQVVAYHATELLESSKSELESDVNQFKLMGDILDVCALFKMHMQTEHILDETCSSTSRRSRGRVQDRGKGHSIWHGVGCRQRSQ